VNIASMLIYTRDSGSGDNCSSMRAHHSDSYSCVMWNVGIRSNTIDKQNVNLQGYM
jgi:hypothetical protein